MTSTELAAVVIAIDLLWPRPAPPAAPARPNRWRFSGRWWEEAALGSRARKPW